jgi:quinol monooxygenase YgiN
MSVIYEVNLQAEPEIAADFAIWLKLHVDKMVALPGFLGARIYREEKSGELAPAWSVHYRLSSRAALEDYFKKHAGPMRQQGIERFGNRCTASRRILFSQPPV